MEGETNYDIKRPRTSSSPVPDSFCCQSTLLANQNCDDTEQKVALPRYPLGYTLVEQVGVGGMSVVFRAFQHGTDRECAIKYVDRFMNRGSVERLEREVRAIAAIEHPNVIKIIACNLTDSIPNFVMEYAGGGTLSEQIEKSHGGLPIKDAVAITEIVARVMAIAHEKGVIHRDLKPGNILLDSKGEIKIADFGLSRNLDTDPAITKPGAIIGTPSFMSPEQAAGMPATRASDIYGTGAILYNLLTGQPPFHHRDQMRTIEAVIRETPVPPRAIRREIPAELEAICLKALEKAPSDRYGSERELAEDLARFRIGTRTNARPRTVACKCWNDVKKYSQWLATAAVILIAVGLATIVWPERPRKRMTQDELTAKIRSGKPITIVNASELLVEPYWMFESAEMKKPKDAKAFSILSSDSAGLGLIRNPGVDSYRITCEMRQHQLASYLNPAKRRPEKFDRLGLMFGNVELPLEQASAHVSTCISFSEFFSTTPCQDLAERNQFNVNQMAYITQPLQPGHLYQERNCQLPLTPPATIQPEWRKMTIEINSRRIVIRDNDQFRTISRDEIVTCRKRLCEKLCKEFGTVSCESMDWSPRQEIGLWVTDSWSGLRNFEIQSMSDGD